MENTAKNIKEILTNDRYVIPRYQRNYAWGRAEIRQLIKDIVEFFDIEKSKKSYYLGSLVCFKREDCSYELIDGQQRHTTLTLINLVLKTWGSNIENVVCNPNIKFDSRKKIQSYIEKLYQANENFQTRIEELNVSGTGKFKEAIEIIQEELRNLEVKKFAENFYQNVFLFRVEVPEDTDLNHYFEIMNSRGEQLEKHEIVKASLMSKINDVSDQKKFSKIWDACANMNHYVFFNFDEKNRKKLFNKDSELKENEFESISFENDKFNNDEENSNTLANIIENIEKHIPKEENPKEENFIQDKYKSIIDFPNFLLQVLKMMNDDVSLDDKKLIEEFDKIKPDPKEFIFKLLKYRVIFDTYVIKQDLSDADENKQNWGIKKLNSDYETNIKTFKDEDDEELVKLQIMLHYADSTNTYNNWLQEILKLEDFSLDNLREKVWNIAKGKFQKDKLSYPDITIYNLYYIDFILWKLYKEYIRGKERIEEVDLVKLSELNELKTKIFTQKNLFNTFRFRQINSREHLLPQSYAKIEPIDEKITSSMNSIGNLCLISASENSSANDNDPIDKKKRFIDKRFIDNSSLKLLIMFESFENDKWGEDQITKHEIEINKLIKHEEEINKLIDVASNQL